MRVCTCVSTCVRVLKPLPAVQWGTTCVVTPFPVVRAGSQPAEPRGASWGNSVPLLSQTSSALCDVSLYFWLAWGRPALTARFLTQRLPVGTLEGSSPLPSLGFVPPCVPRVVLVQTGCMGCADRNRCHGRGSPGLGVATWPLRTCAWPFPPQGRLGSGGKRAWRERTGHSRTAARPCAAASRSSASLAPAPSQHEPPPSQAAALLVGLGRKGGGGEPWRAVPFPRSAVVPRWPSPLPAETPRLRPQPALPPGQHP